MTSSQLESLAAYTACDISDALLKLQVPAAGFLGDFLPYAPHGPYSPALSTQPKVVAPASTVLFISKDASHALPSEKQGITETNIPAGEHYVDRTKPDTIIVLSQPAAHKCACLGGIMALRMKTCRAKGVIVGGRMRDLAEIRGLDFPVWALGISTVGTGLESKPWAIDVPIEVQGVTIVPGDIVFADPVEGVVVIPQDKMDAVLELLPRLTAADDKVKEDVERGSLVKDAFEKHRRDL